MRIVHIQNTELILHLTLHVQWRWNCGVKHFISVSLKISTMLCSALRVRRKWIIRNLCLAYLVLQRKSWIRSPASALLLELGWLQWLHSAHRTHCCPLPQWWESWCTACLFSCSLFFPSLNSASPTSGTQGGQRWMEGREKQGLHSGRISSKINKVFLCPGTTWQRLQTPCRKQSHLPSDSIWKLSLLAQINRKHHLQYAMLRYMYRISIYVYI